MLDEIVCQETVTNPIVNNDINLIQVIKNDEVLRSFYRFLAENNLRQDALAQVIKKMT